MKLSQEKIQKLIVPFVVPILLLLLTLFTRLPYFYYILLRFVVCGAMAYCAYCAWKEKRNSMIWPYVVIGIIFNPVARIHLNKDLYILTIVGIAILFFIEISDLSKQNK